MDTDTWHRIWWWLDAHDAAEIEHPGGTLLAHLERTARQLVEWHASEALQVAGLAHAVYGTDGFPRALVSTKLRDKMVALLGAGAEAIVYTYGSCDRRATYPALLAGSPVVEHFDRFLSQRRALSEAELGAFVDLTIANELDVLEHRPAWRADLVPLLTACRARASDAARAAVDQAIG